MEQFEKYLKDTQGLLGGLTDDLKRLTKNTGIFVPTKSAAIKYKGKRAQMNINDTGMITLIFNSKTDAKEVYALILEECQRK